MEIFSAELILGLLPRPRNDMAAGWVMWVAGGRRLALFAFEVVRASALVVSAGW